MPVLLNAAQGAPERRPANDQTGKVERTIDAEGPDLIEIRPRRVGVPPPRQQCMHVTDNLSSQPRPMARHLALCSMSRYLLQITPAERVRLVRPRPLCGGRPRPCPSWSP